MANMIPGVPTKQEMMRYSVNRPGAQEVVRQSLYDFQTYDATNGHSTLTFFQVPAGQSSKTKEDTNMELAGTLPAPKNMLVQSIEIRFYPGVNPSTVNNNDADFDLTSAEFINDVYTLAKKGFLRLFIGSKDYLLEAPLDRFPAKSYLNVAAATAAAYTQASGADGARQANVQYATLGGRPYNLVPPITLPATQNFSVSLEWPGGAQALPSGVDGRIGIILDGLLFRLSQ